MIRDQISRVLKHYRKLNNLSTAAVSDVLRKNDFRTAPKTIYGWESGNTLPRADVLMFLCDFYQIDDIRGVFFESQESAFKPLSPEEKIIIEAYRDHPNHQNLVKRILEVSDSEPKDASITT